MNLFIKSKITMLLLLLPFTSLFTSAIFLILDLMFVPLIRFACESFGVRNCGKRLIHIDWNINPLMETQQGCCFPGDIDIDDFFSKRAREREREECVKGFYCAEWVASAAFDFSFARFLVCSTFLAFMYLNGIYTDRGKKSSCRIWIQ